MTLEEEIKELKAKAERYHRINLLTVADECRRIVEWLEELKELRKKAKPKEKAPH